MTPGVPPQEQCRQADGVSAWTGIFGVAPEPEMPAAFDEDRETEDQADRRARDHADAETEQHGP